MDNFVVRAKRKVRDSTPPCKTKKSKSDDKNDKTSSEVPHELVQNKNMKWRKIKAVDLDLDYCIFLGRSEADRLFQQCEKELQYNTGQLAKICIFGKWVDIPRKQVAFGDRGLTYTFSGNTVPARPWTPMLQSIRDSITQATGHRFNFVLINRYANGQDYMGEHRDDEKDLVRESPIASLSLGQHRDFIFRHAEARGKNKCKDITPVKLELEHGSLLMMNYPTNVHWYHALPRRSGAHNVRINMTFRDFVVNK